MSYSDLKNMDFAEFYEAVEAKKLYNEKIEAERRKAKGGGD